MTNNAPEAPEHNELEPAQRQDLMLRPVGSAKDLLGMFQEYQRLTEALLVEEDYQTIGNKKHPKKSAWRKLSTAFGVDCELVDNRIFRNDLGQVQSAEFVYRAIAPNGRRMDGWGSCNIKEKCCVQPCKKASWNNHTCCTPDCTGAVHFSHPNHDIPATAETRAKNRAISDLIGKGEVSAEEILDAGATTKRAEPERPQPNSARTREKTKAQPAAKASGGSGDKSGPADEKALVARLRREIERRAPDHPKVKDGTLVSKGPAIIWKIAKQVGVVDENGKFVPDPNEPEPAPAEPEASNEEAKPEPAPEPEAEKGAATGYAQYWLQLCEQHGWDPHDALAWVQSNGHGEVKALMKLDPKTKAGQALRGAIRGLVGGGVSDWRGGE